MKIHQRFGTTCRGVFVVMAATGNVCCFVDASRAAEGPSKGEASIERTSNPNRSDADEEKDECTLSDDRCAYADAGRDTEQLLLGLEGDLVSRYLWRGLALSTGPVLQPSIWVALRNFTIGASANLNLHREATFRGIDFFMPEATYRWSWQRFVVEPGVIGYVDQPGSSPAGSTRSSTAEASLKLSYGVGPLLLSSAHYIDLVTTPGAYYGSAALQAARCVPLGQLRAYVELGWASASFNREHHGVDSTGLSVFIGGAEVRADITDAVYVALHTEGSALLTQALRHSTREPDLYNVGVAIGVEASP